MEPESRYTLVGATLLALVALAVGVFLWLSNVGTASDFRFYTIWFERQSLDGLQVGGDVNMRGVTVGRVEEYEIDPYNINRVKVIVRVDRRTPVSTNTSAVMARNLVTGVARINLNTPGTPGPALVDVPHGERYPLIAEGKSNLDEIAGAANRLALTGEAALASLNEVLSPENRKTFAETLVAMRDLSVGLNQRLATIDTAARAVEESGAAFRDASVRLAAVAERIAVQLEPVAREAQGAMGEARATLREAQVTFRDSQSTLRDLSSAVKAFEREAVALAQRTEAATDVGTLELRATAQEVRVSAEKLSRALERLQDPRAALLGPGPRQLGPGEDAK